MRTPGRYRREYEPEGSKGYFFGDYCNWARIPEYRDFVLHARTAALAARLMDSRTARFFHEHVLVKEPLTESRTPWHHDLPYYCIDGTQCVSFWTALDPVPRAVPGACRGLPPLGQVVHAEEVHRCRLPAGRRGAGYHAGHRRAS